MASNSNSQKWQQAIDGISMMQSKLSPEELSAFNALVELYNSGDSKSDESGGYVRIIANVLPQHAKNRILYVHLKNFVALCEQYFEIKSKTPPIPTQSRTKQTLETQNSGRAGIPTRTGSRTQQTAGTEVQSPGIDFSGVSQQLGKAGDSLKKTSVQLARGLAPIGRWFKKHFWKMVVTVGVVAVIAVVLFFVHQRMNEVFQPASDGQSWGFVNSRGNFAISPQFEAAYAFSDGLARIRLDGKTGYVNRRGELVIPAIYTSGTAFNDGLAFVVSDGGHPTAIDNRGNVRFVLNTAEYVSAFSEGVAMFIAHDGQRRFVDRAGNVVANAQVDKAIEELHFIRSDFYDASEFIRLFFGREAGNTFDGVNASTTLIELSNHPIYGAGLNARSEHLADYGRRIQITNDIAISHIGFHFGTTPIFNWIDTYNDWGQRIDRRQEFDFDASPDAIVYHFALGGRAIGRSSAVASALKTEVERRQGQSMSSMNRGGRNIYYLPQEGGKLSFAIVNDGATIVLHVAFREEYLSNQFR